ncbi:SusD/RagB family nutrient-binding outer membrane lipoprotein [Solitalea koreensis]|uniref:Starch-binding associating with outer membrane n=1 Tax=Solitalea koreensis TaxID=543615 RepID=A0A521AAD7_9SPHI|nr:SusD/RagB family nutrient-binding outer membrane lipoprotein [Solitalea koreensis]SMO31769.1 Starch-binding associating with outer membrane [Solitalea koreensis]
MKFNYKKNIAAPLMIGLSMAIGLSSCQKDFGDINKPWDSKAYSATIPAMYNNLAVGMLEAGTSRTIFSSFLYQNTQLAANYAASGYRLNDQVGGAWTNYYTALANYREVETMIAKDLKADKMTNVKAMLKTLMAYKTLKATTLFGDMPYSQAGKGFSGPEFYRPAYDQQSDIMLAALNDLKWAVDNFNTNTDQYSLGSSETIFKNDIPTWIKFANSLRLRYAMVMRNKNASLADPIIVETLTKPLLAPGDNLGIYPSQVTGLTLNRAPSFRGNSYVRMGSTMWNAMSSTNATDGSGIYDLRCKILFEPNKAGQWVPYPQSPTEATTAEIVGDAPYLDARKTNFVSTGNYLYSPLSIFYVADDKIPELFITAAEVSLLKAEIYNRGIAGVVANPVTAKAFYEEGIAESVKFWYKTANSTSIGSVTKPNAAPTALELSTMLMHPAVAYNVANPAAALAQIYKQSWIALFHQPYDAWVLKRRTGNGTPNVALSPSSPVINLNKLVYPNSEMETNYENWKVVTGGADDMASKPWFMN